MEEPIIFLKSCIAYLGLDFNILNTVSNEKLFRFICLKFEILLTSCRPFHINLPKFAQTLLAFLVCIYDIGCEDGCQEVALGLRANLKFGVLYKAIAHTKGLWVCNNRKKKPHVTSSIHIKLIISFLSTCTTVFCAVLRHFCTTVG